MKQNNLQRNKMARDIRAWNEDDWSEDIYGSVDIYAAEGRDSALEQDELATWEAAFMDGYDAAI